MNDENTVVSEENEEPIKEKKSAKQIIRKSLKIAGKTLECL